MTKVVILTIVGLMFAIAIAGGALATKYGREADRRAPAPPAPALSVSAHDKTLVIRGCKAEDSCTVDYNRRGEWTITKKPVGSW